MVQSDVTIVVPWQLSTGSILTTFFVSILYTPQKLSDLVTNCNKNIVLFGKYQQKWLPWSSFARNLLNSHPL